MRKVSVSHPSVQEDARGEYPPRRNCERSRSSVSRRLRRGTRPLGRQAWGQSASPTHNSPLSSRRLARWLWEAVTHSCSTLLPLWRASRISATAMCACDRRCAAEALRSAAHRCACGATPSPDEGALEGPAAPAAWPPVQWGTSRLPTYGHFTDTKQGCLRAPPPDGEPVRI
jgi:hypothetical protein